MERNTTAPGRAQVWRRWDHGLQLVLTSVGVIERWFEPSRAHANWPASKRAFLCTASDGFRVDCVGDLLYRQRELIADIFDVFDHQSPGYFERRRQFADRLHAASLSV